MSRSIANFYSLNVLSVSWIVKSRNFGRSVFQWLKFSGILREDLSILGILKLKLAGNTPIYLRNLEDEICLKGVRM
jgi:hypothetical protein